MKSIFTAFIFTWLFVASGQAQYLSKESFTGYTSGAKLQSAGGPAVGGYAGDWTDIDFGDAEPVVYPGSLTYAHALYAGSGGGMVGKGADNVGGAVSNSGRVFRLLDSSLKADDATVGTRYVSWLFRTGNENAAANASTYQTLALYDGNTADANRNFDAGIAAGDFGTENYAFRAENSSALRGDLGVTRNAAVHLFVAKFSFSAANNADSVTVWIDPAPGSAEPAGGVTRSGFNLRFDRLALSDYSSNSVFWDEIRWGTTFGSVTTLPGQPLFIQQPVAYAGSVNDTVLLTAEAIASPTPSYQWEFSPPGSTGWSPLPGATSAICQIASAPYSARGRYRVIASNASGLVTSQEVTVDLVFPNPTITQQPASIGVQPGGNASFSVTATGLGILSYQWLKDGVEIAGATAASLVLGPLDETALAAYSVRISDSAAATEGLPPTVTVSDPALLIFGNIADYEVGVTFRLYDVREAMVRLFPLVPGQTPNVDEKRSVINWTGAADFGGLNQQFIVECSADLHVSAPGEFRFRLTSSDGSALWIDDGAVLDHDGEHEAIPKEGGVTLAPGLHPLRLRFFQNSGMASLKLEWKPPGAGAFTVVPASAFLTTAGVTRVVAPGKKNIIRPGDGSRPGSGQPLNVVHPSWQVATIHPPAFKPKVGAMAFHPDGRLLLTTFNPNQNSTPEPLPGGDGKVWALANVQSGDASSVTVTEVASGLSEPLGMAFINGDLYVTERIAVTRLRDGDGDGYYETHDTVGSGWVSNNYHHFHFGLIEKDGFAYSTLSTTINFDYPGLNGPNPPNRGTLVRTNLANGQVSYLAGGLRTPNGLCFGPEGEIFQTDNQGAWQPASRLNHLRQGHFYGHRNSTADGGSPSLYSDQPETAPAVWFPQNEVANSPSQPVMIPRGPFSGDLLVGDITLGGINRVSLEKVQGVWQGCIYRFTQGLEGGVNRLAWGPDGALYVGCIGATGNWSWNGTQTGLQRLSPKPGNAVTFEIGKVGATADGFEITYTKPVPAATLSNLANYTVRQWSYLATAEYGGPKIGEETLAVSSATVSADRMRVSLAIPGLARGHVVYLKSDPVSDDGSAILSSEVWYTLNEIPAGPYSLNLDNRSIRENLPPGTAVGEFSASHDTLGEPIAFSLPPEGAADNAFFSIAGNVLQAERAFDYERRRSYQVRVRATDSGGRSNETDFTIQVGDEQPEHLPHRIVLSNAVVPPDHQANAFVGTLLAYDDDLGDRQQIEGAVMTSSALVEEPFDYSAGQSVSAQAGGKGFSGQWGTMDTASSIQSGSLSYRDIAGFALVGGGGRGRCAMSSRNHRPLASARGADGTVTYFSFIADPGANVHFWGVELWNGTAVAQNRVFQLGNETGFGVRVRNGTNKFFSIPDSSPHFYVVKIDHLAGNDRVSVWIDPALTAEPAAPTLLFTPTEVGGSITFNRIGFSNYVADAALEVDELRLGDTWGSVTPHQASSPRFELVVGEGGDDNSHFLIHGDRLYIAGILPRGLQKIRVRVTDSAGLSHEQKLLVWIGEGHLDEDGDGITNAQEVRMGLDPTNPADADADPDGDGWRNGQEVAFGSDPFDRKSVPWTSSIADPIGRSTRLESLVFPGHLYWAEMSPDLLTWSMVAGSIHSPAPNRQTDGAIWNLPWPSGPRHFWRLASGWPTLHTVDLLANGLAGLTFVGGSSGWSFDGATGILKHDGTLPSEWLHTGKVYSDFLLSLDYRLSSGGNAGVFLRAAASGNPWETGTEIQVTNEPRLPIHSTGALYDRIAAEPAADARAGVWHRMEVALMGNRIRVVIDGVPTVDLENLREAYSGFDWPLSGLVGLQNSHASVSGTVEYRNVRIISWDP